MRKRIKRTIGVSDFKKLHDINGYFVDKSLLIKEVWEDSEVILLPRPRRFGKTLNLSMLRYFFEISDEDKKYLFEGLKIWDLPEYRDMQGRFPVIFLTFKDVKERDFDAAIEKTKRNIADIFRDHRYVTKVLDESEKIAFETIIDLTASRSLYENSLKALSAYLERFHGQKTLVLVDEYDVPIQGSYVNGYYDEMVDFMRGFLSGAFKDNTALAKGVITGCLRVAKESIFTGMNNLAVYSLLSEGYAQYFGFTEPELQKILMDTNLTEHFDKIRQWYNGYMFGRKVIYNPWSILNYTARVEDGLKPYWINTSSNDLIKELVLDYGIGLKTDMEMLLRDEPIEKPIDENVSFTELHETDTNVWSLLLFSGYLKPVQCRQNPEGDQGLMCKLLIPDKEVKLIFRQIFMNWMSRGVGSSRDVQMMIRAMLGGEQMDFEALLNKLMINALSYHDTARPEPEKVYHAFILGLLVNMGENFLVKSNPESGFGRVDVMITPKNGKGPGVIMELKVANRDYEKDIETAFENARKQVEAKKYEQNLIARGINPIIKYLAVFDGKRVWVREA